MRLQRRLYGIYPVCLFPYIHGSTASINVLFLPKNLIPPWNHIFFRVFRSSSQSHSLCILDDGVLYNTVYGTLHCSVHYELYSVTYKEWYFRDSCAKFTLSISLLTDPCNSKLVSFFAKSLYKPLYDYITVNSGLFQVPGRLLTS